MMYGVTNLLFGNHFLQITQSELVSKTTVQRFGGVLSAPNLAPTKSAADTRQWKAPPKSPTPARRGCGRTGPGRSRRERSMWPRSGSHAGHPPSWMNQWIRSRNSPIGTDRVAPAPSWKARTSSDSADREAAAA
jgi:hypothetical protein